MFWHTARANGLLELRNHRVWFCAGTAPVTFLCLRGNPCVGWGSPYEKDLLGASAPHAVLQEPVLPKTPPEQLWAGRRHQDRFAFNLERPGIWVYITWLPSWIKTSPRTSLRDGDFPLGCSRSQGAAPTCPCWSRRYNYQNGGCSTSPSAAPESHTGSAQPGWAGELCLDLGQDEELCLGSPALPRALTAHPPAQEGRWPQPAAAPAPVALSVTCTFTL